MQKVQTLIQCCCNRLISAFPDEDAVDERPLNEIEYKNFKTKEYDLSEIFDKLESSLKQTLIDKLSDNKCISDNNKTAILHALREKPSEWSMIFLEKFERRSKRDHKKFIEILCQIGLSRHARILKDYAGK